MQEKSSKVLFANCRILLHAIFSERYIIYNISLLFLLTMQKIQMQIVNAQCIAHVRNTDNYMKMFAVYRLSNETGVAFHLVFQYYCGFIGLK